MAVTDELALARSYKRAGDALVEKALSDADLSYKWAYPVLFLYRHTIELNLKLIVRPIKPNHKMPELVEQFCSVVGNKLGLSVPQWATNRLLEFSEVDPESQAFRYAKDRKGGWSMVQGGEWWVDFNHLRKTMDVLVQGFERAHFCN